MAKDILTWYNMRRDQKIGEMIEALRIIMKNSALAYSDQPMRRFSLFIDNPSDQNFAELISAMADYRENFKHTKHAKELRQVCPNCKGSRFADGQTHEEAPLCKTCNGSGR